MNKSQASRLAVIGAGTMGAQIAAQAALHDFEVALIDTDEESLRRAEAGNRKQLQRRVEKGALSQTQVDEAMNRVQGTTDLLAAGSAFLVIEAVFEDLDTKRAVFSRLVETCGPDAILATNSSTIPISRIFDDLPYPERACNMHFFHPVLVMKLVEIMRGPETSDETVESAVDFVRRIDRQAVVVEREIPGLIVNRILGALKREALWLADEGYASPEDIDTAVKLGLNHPMGPFELTDFSGLDVFYSIMLQRYQETGDEAWKPSALLERKVKAGHLGRKTGRGFYEYD
ncbi:MAG TPA: 3-hydroxyacyl-CoA dehydrogenase family protein [Chloroflexota bacterium]|nr:3-hydroxyacyl-CoA dehydrogenase family protein [Chloroflexota bacterium]